MYLLVLGHAWHKIIRISWSDNKYSITQENNYRIWQNFHWLKFSPKANTLYWDKNFANRTNYLPGSSGWSSQVIGMCYAHALTITRAKINVSKFHCAKNSRKKISPLACIGEIGENFLLAKISVYIVPLSAMHRLGTDELTHACTCTPPPPMRQWQHW